jgi:electron-transferring-flavoprotein dehydrogenase
MGLTKSGEPGPNHQPGVELHARLTLMAEGCRGSLTKRLFERFNLRDGVAPQTYGLGVKELWEVEPGKHRPGKIVHTIGWPLDQKTYGGSWLYHFGRNLVSVGFVVGLDYSNPYLSPFEEMQRYKTHPAIRPLFEDGRRVAYGARALSEGGFQSIPRLDFPGGAILGDAAGFLNVPKIKGTHLAMKSGIVAAEAAYDALQGGAEAPSMAAYPERLKRTWLWDELYRVRNIRGSFRAGLLPALAYSALDTYLLRGRAPWTLPVHADHEALKKAADSRRIEYPKPDGKITFDRLSSVFLSNTNHEEDQPSHLVLKDPNRPLEVNLPEYGGPEQYYCPAGVYEYVGDGDGKQRLQINAQNCVHCKTCDIKDPTQNIEWVTPQGGGGPNYPGGM